MLLFGWTGVRSLFALTTDPTTFGTRVDVFAVISSACLTGSPVGSAVATATAGDYRGGQVFAMLCVFAAAGVAKTGLVLGQRIS